MESMEKLIKQTNSQQKSNEKNGNKTRTDSTNKMYYSKSVKKTQTEFES